MKMLIRNIIFSAFMVCFVISNAFAAASPEQAGNPVEDKPGKGNDRVTIVSVQNEGTDSIGTRLATRLKERFNQSSLFSLHDNEEKDVPKMRIMLMTTPEFPSRPNVGSIYGLCWVFSQGKGYLGLLLQREIGTVNYDDIDGLVDKIVERTDGIAAKYSELLKQSR